MKTQMQVDIEGACESARIKANKYKGHSLDRDPARTIIEWFDAEIKDSIEYDKQIVEARANVIRRSQDMRDAHDVEAARKKVLEAIDELERVTLERGKANDVAAIIKWHKG